MIEINRIIDGHCHVAATDFTSRSFRDDGVMDNVLSALTAQGLEAGSQQSPQLYLEKMQDRASGS